MRCTMMLMHAHAPCMYIYIYIYRCRCISLSHSFAFRFFRGSAVLYRFNESTLQLQPDTRTTLDKSSGCPKQTSEKNSLYVPWLLRSFSPCAGSSHHLPIQDGRAFLRIIYPYRTAGSIQHLSTHVHTGRPGTSTQHLPLRQICFWLLGLYAGIIVFL